MAEYLMFIEKKETGSSFLSHMLLGEFSGGINVNMTES